MLYLLKGNNEYELKKRLDALTSELDVDNTQTSFTYEDLKKGANNIPELVREHAFTMPFMGSTRVVVVNRLFSDLQYEKFPAKLNAIQDFMESFITPDLELPANNHLIFYEPYEEIAKPQRQIFKLFDDIIEKISKNKSTQIKVIEES